MRIRLLIIDQEYGYRHPYPGISTLIFYYERNVEDEKNIKGYANQIKRIPQIMSRYLNIMEVGQLK